MGSSILFWTGLIGGTIGTVAGVLALIDRWRDRHPRLHLFAPHNFYCKMPSSGTEIWNILVRFSNTSRCAAYLYIETLAVDIKRHGRFHKARTLISEFGAEVQTDFSESE